jgi:hypothetical protein
VREEEQMKEKEIEEEDGQGQNAIRRKKWR